MKRLVILIMLAIYMTVAVFAQKYTIYKPFCGKLRYEVPERGEWVDKSKWIELYGKKRFKEIYDDRWQGEYDHVEERDYVRWNYAKTLEVEINSSKWQRVFPLQHSIEDAKQLAANTLLNAVVTDNVVEGYIEDADFINWQPGIIYSMENNIWKAHVRYEFKDDRYRVTLTNIKSKLKFIVGAGTYIRLETINYYEPIYNLLYNDGIRAGCYDVFINSIDYTFCELFMLRGEVEVTADDW